MITAALALLNSPLAWFALLLLALTSAGALFRLVLLTAPDSMEEPPAVDARAAEYHASNALGR